MSVVVSGPGLWQPALAQAEDWPPAANLLEPMGVAAARTAGVWWYLFYTALAVFAVVTALLVVGLLVRGREITDGGATNDRRVTPLLLVGVGVTAAILLVTAGITFVTMRALAEPSGAATHRVEVLGKQWWWEVRVDGATVGANEIHIPVGEPVLLELRSDNVIHSFWVPDLAGKRDLVPGQTNTLWLEADAPGVYRGVCAEFCGVQHANMQFVVVAEAPEAFGAWLERVRAPAARPESEAARVGQAVFMNEGCAGCHAVRGTAARGQLGPDLTHLASRLTLGAGILPNTRGHLGGWVVNPQAIKPGNHMPPQALSSGELEALLSYLAGLE